MEIFLATKNGRRNLKSDDEMSAITADHYYLDESMIFLIT